MRASTPLGFFRSEVTDVTLIWKLVMAILATYEQRRQHRQPARNGASAGTRCTPRTHVQAMNPRKRADTVHTRLHFTVTVPDLPYVTDTIQLINSTDYSKNQYK